MDDFLHEFREHPLVIEAGIELDFSVASLDAVEALILKRFPKFEDVKKTAAASEINLFSIYVGETIRKNGGGRWGIDYEDEKMAFFSLPVVKGVGAKRVTDCPMTLVTASTDRRRGDYLSSVVRNLIE